MLFQIITEITKPVCNATDTTDDTSGNTTTAAENITTIVAGNNTTPAAANITTTAAAIDNNDTTVAHELSNATTTIGNENTTSTTTTTTTTTTSTTTLKPILLDPNIGCYCPGTSDVREPKFPIEDIKEILTSINEKRREEQQSFEVSLDIHIYLGVVSHDAHRCQKLVSLVSCILRNISQNHQD